MRYAPYPEHTIASQRPVDTQPLSRLDASYPLPDCPAFLFSRWLSCMKFLILCGSLCGPACLLFLASFLRLSHFLPLCPGLCDAWHTGGICKNPVCSSSVTDRDMPGDPCLHGGCAPTASLMSREGERRRLSHVADAGWNRLALQKLCGAVYRRQSLGDPRTLWRSMSQRREISVWIRNREGGCCATSLFSGLRSYNSS